MQKLCVTLLLILNGCFVHIHGQIKPLSSNEIQLGLQRLNTLGTVLYFAAHPDDENTRLITWLAQEKKYRTAYISLTRGDGGQNLIGTEQGIELGLIRTQELLAARTIDKGEQIFSSAYDFGFSKTHNETFNYWDKETALREAVYIIRKLQPDIIINRFPPDKRGGHGHHQASAILSHEAYIAAADPKAFPEQLTELKPWKAKRLIWNTANFGGINNTSEDQLKINIGTYNPLLGKSYGEIAAESRSQHKSQGFGSASNRGANIEYFEHIAGSKAQENLMEGIETSWRRIENTDKIQNIINELNTQFDPNQPQKSINLLFELKNKVSSINNEHWKRQKIEEIDRLILACAGVWIDATTKNSQYPINSNFDVNVESIYQNEGITVELIEINKKQVNKTLNFNTILKEEINTMWQKITQPYWLERPHTLGKFNINEKDLGNPSNSDNPSVNIKLKINNNIINVSTKIKYKHVDPVQGELYEDITITPTISASVSSENIIILNSTPQKASITFTRYDKKNNSFLIATDSLKDWEITPKSFQLHFDNNDVITKEFEIKAKSKTAKEETLRFSYNNEFLHNIKTIQYSHIPSIKWFPITEAKIQNLQIKIPIKKIAYIDGAGDLIAKSLNQIGIETSILNNKQITEQNLSQFDAVIVGIRYYNIEKDSQNITPILLNYVKNGGTVLVQYNVNTNLHTENIGPYPFKITRTRVTEENAPVDFDTNDIALNYPNKITSNDFEDWIQERGLYFLDNIDNKYRSPLKIADQNETKSNGGLLIANYGKGKFVYTSLSFFRQLPAGVPGAYRLFVNLLTKEK